MLWDAPQATRRLDASGVPVRRDGGEPKVLFRGARGALCRCLTGAEAPAKNREWRTLQTDPFNIAQRASGGLRGKGEEMLNQVALVGEVGEFGIKLSYRENGQPVMAARMCLTQSPSRRRS